MVIRGLGLSVGWVYNLTTDVRHSGASSQGDGSTAWASTLKDPDGRLALLSLCVLVQRVATCCSSMPLERGIKVFRIQLMGAFSNLPEGALVDVNNQVDVCKSMAKSNKSYDVLTRSMIRRCPPLVQSLKFNRVCVFFF